MELVAHDRHLWSLNENNSLNAEICQEVRVSYKERDLLSGSTTACVTICHDDGDEEYKIPKKLLNRKMIQELLMDKDIAIADDDDTTADVVDYIRDTDKTAPVHYYHQKLGFEMLNGGLVYLSSRPIGNLSETKKASQYINMEELGMKGSFDSWRQVIEEEVLGNLYLELGLAIGASAPLVYLLRKDGMYAELPVIALIGASSTGKSSCCKLAASLFGSPTEGSGLVKDLNSTQNAFFRQMAARQGTCFIFDEATGKSDWAITDAAYSLVKGMEKARCSANGKLNDRATFSGTVLLSGEHSLLSDTKLNCGVLARIVEFQDFRWTTSAEHADRLCQKISKNHGHAIIPLMEHILAAYSVDTETFAELFRQELALLKQLQPTTHGVEGRVYNIYATLLVAAKVAGEAWKMPLHVEDIRRLLLQHHKQMRPIESHAKRMYDLIVTKINQHVSCFPLSNRKNRFEEFESSRVMGKREKKEDKIIVWITDGALSDFTKEKFPNPTQFIKELADMGLFYRDSSRHYRFSKKLCIGECICYGVITDDVPVCNPKVQRKSNSKINLLLDDNDDIEEKTNIGDVAC